MNNKNSALKGVRPGSIQISVHDTDDSRAIVNAAVSVFASDTDCANFVAAAWRSDPARHVATTHTDRHGAAVFSDLAPGVYVVMYDHYPLTDSQCVEVHAGCNAVVCFALALDRDGSLVLEVVAEGFEEVFGRLCRSP